MPRTEQVRPFAFFWSPEWLRRWTNLGDSRAKLALQWLLYPRGGRNGLKTRQFHVQMINVYAHFFLVDHKPSGEENSFILQTPVLFTLSVSKAWLLTNHEPHVPAISSFYVLVHNVFFITVNATSPQSTIVWPKADLPFSFSLFLSNERPKEYYCDQHKWLKHYSFS